MRLTHDDLRGLRARSCDPLVREVFDRLLAAVDAGIVKLDPDQVERVSDREVGKLCDGKVFACSTDLVEDVARDLRDLRAAMRVALVPAQLWRADSAGWSRSVTWSETRLALDSAVQAVLQERGLGKKWAYASDVVRSAKRNPTYASDPYSL